MGALALRVTGATKRYHRDGRPLTVFHSLDLAVRTGEVFALLSPSGCGKSTLLRVLAGLEALSAGQVEIGWRGGESLAARSGRIPLGDGCREDGERLAPATGPGDSAVGAQPDFRIGVSCRDGAGDTGGDQNCRPLGIVLQEPLLFPWLTVAENVALGLRYRANRAAKAAVDQVLRDFGLAPVAHAYPSELSGGQAQRASLARTIVTRPAILLLDEPFGALDPRTRAALQDWLREIVRRRRLTVVLVTHDVDEALYLGDRVALMSSPPSTIVNVWEVRRTVAEDGGEASGGGCRHTETRRQAIRQEILALYQTDVLCVPAGPSPANWVI